MKTVQQPRGTTAQEDSVTGAEGQIRVDLTRGEIRMHDGIKQGGHRIPNIETVRDLIATGGDSTSQGVEVPTTLAALKAITPAANKLAVLNLAGSEDVFVWQAGAAPDAGAVTSDIEGHWQRLDSQVGLYVRMHRAGVFTMQIEGAEPVANQDTTPWINAGVVKLWNGASYAAATPTLFARLLAQIGSYAVGAVVLPDRLAEIATEDTDLDTLTLSGWYKSSAAAANAPVAGVHIVEHRQIDADDAIQFFHLHNNTNRDMYVRYCVAGVWGSWTLVPGTLPARIESSSSTVTDANSANESGFYNAASTATNLPVAENGTIQVIKRSSTAMSQIFVSTDATKVYVRRMTAGAWQAWKAVYPAAMGDATGTLAIGNVGVSTISQAEAEAGTATTERWFTAERAAQAITNLIGGALRTLRALTLAAGDLVYATGAGVLARLAIGTSGYVLTSNGSAPTWAAPAATGGMTLLATLATTSGSVTSGVAIDSSYRDVHVEYEGVSFSGASGSNGISMSLSASAGSAYGAAAKINVGAPSGASDTINGVVTLEGVQISHTKRFLSRGWSQVSTSDAAEFVGGIIATDTAGNVDMVRFHSLIGNFDAGAIRVYGVK